MLYTTQTDLGVENILSLQSRMLWASGIAGQLHNNGVAPAARRAHINRNQHAFKACVSFMIKTVHILPKLYLRAPAAER